MILQNFFEHTRTKVNVPFDVNPHLKACLIMYFEILRQYKSGIFLNHIGSWLSAAGPAELGGKGGLRISWRSVNPTSTRGADYAPTYLPAPSPPPRFSDLPPALLLLGWQCKNLWKEKGYVILRELLTINWHEGQKFANMQYELIVENGDLNILSFCKSFIMSTEFDKRIFKMIPIW